MNALADAAALMRDDCPDSPFMHAVADLIEWNDAHDVGGPSWRLADAAVVAYLGRGASS